MDRNELNDEPSTYDLLEAAGLLRKERRENGMPEETPMKAYMVSINGTHEIRIEAKTKADAERQAVAAWCTARAELLPPDQWPAKKTSAI